jgi:hypothetical protein
MPTKCLTHNSSQKNQKNILKLKYKLFFKKLKEKEIIVPRQKKQRDF